MTEWLIGVDLSNGHVSSVVSGEAELIGESQLVPPGRLGVSGVGSAGEVARVMRSGGASTVQVGAGARPAVVLIDGHVKLPSTRVAGVSNSIAHDLFVAYRTAGVRCLEGISGQWTTLIVDPNRCRILAARDATGTRPLYYRRYGCLWVFGSNARRLAVNSLVPACAVDAEAILEWISSLNSRAWSTAFGDVRRLPPGCYLEVDNGRATLSDWWQPSPWVSTKGDLAEVHLNRFRLALEQSILDSFLGMRVPAISLSSGLDSSTIAVIAKSLHQKNRIARPIAVSQRFPNFPESDESARILLSVQRLGFEGHWVEPTPYESLEGVFAFADHPRELLAIPVMFALGRSAAQLGSDAIALGTFGDAVGGRPARWPHLCGESSPVRASDTVLASYGRIRGIASVLRRRIPPWVALRNRIISLCLKGIEGSVIRVRLASLGQGYDARPFGARPEESFDLTGRTDASANTITHILGRFGISPTFPFLDRRVVEASLALPPSSRSYLGFSRWAERLICRGTLPDQIWLTRRKTLFNRFHDEYRRHVVSRYWPTVPNDLHRCIDFQWLSKVIAQGGLDDRQFLDVAYRAVVACAWLNATLDDGN